jgi:hypothetical protein
MEQQRAYRQGVSARRCQPAKHRFLCGNGVRVDRERIPAARKADNLVRINAVTAHAFGRSDDNIFEKQRLLAQFES